MNAHSTLESVGDRDSTRRASCCSWMGLRLCCLCMFLLSRRASSFLLRLSPRVASIMSATTDTVFSAPSDPSFVHPASDFPPLSIFEQSIEHPALLVPAGRTAELRNQLSHVILHRPRTKSVYPVDEDSSLRKLVLKHDANVYDDDVVQKLLMDKTCQKSSHTCTLTYKDWTVDQVLKKLLPMSEIPSAFETVGHIAHVNLRDNVLPFKYIVGKVILDKNAPRIQTVVNKIGSIETQYRTFGMEVIAGNDKEGWSIVNLREEGCHYELDFRQVYWNSRLGGEHRRLVQIIKREQQQHQQQQQQQQQSPPPPMVVADIMAGVGPFAVPLTAHSNPNIVVHANDLNPFSYKYLVMNGRKNKCGDNLHCYQMDGRAFVHELCNRGIEISHAILNLPASAPEFLDAFIGYTGKQLPRIHVHCFGSKKRVVAESAEEEAIQRCAKALNCPLDRVKDQVSVHIVRDVAPNKNMLCVSFTLPPQVREQPRIDTWSTSTTTTTTTDEPPPNKRIKL